MKKIKLNRKKINFEVEFPDGAKFEYEYFEPTTKQIDKGVDIDGVKERLAYAKETLSECLRSKADGAVEKLIEYQNENGNIYDFKGQLDEELGKLSKRG